MARAESPDLYNAPAVPAKELGMHSSQTNTSHLTAADLRWLYKIDEPRAVHVRQQCGDCQYFMRDAVNPPGGVGKCTGARCGETMYPGQDKMCPGFEAAAGDAA